MIVEKLSDSKKLADVINKLHSEPWPVFLSEDSSVKKYWQRLYQVYPEYQLLFRINSEYIGVANSAPIYWNGSMDSLPSMIVKETVSDWQRWTGMHFGESNKYIIQGALNPVNIDLENNLGEYIEPNVWVLHKC